MNFIGVDSLDRIVQETINAVQKGKQQIFEIAENTRQEVERVRGELIDIKQKTLFTIQEVDRQVNYEKQARQRLMEVSGDFKRFGEQDIREAYENAKEIQVKLALLRQKEEILRQRRDELERSLQRLDETVKKAENLITHVGVVLDFMENGLQDVGTRLDDFRRCQLLGLKVILAQENERRRVAREIHDGPAQAITNIVLRSEICEKLIDTNPQEMRKELRALKIQMREVLQDIRKIMFDLRPVSLDDLGVVAAVKRYLAEYEERYKLPIQFTFFGENRRLKSVLEVTLFRFIQEAITNIFKHASATSVKVKLEIALNQVIAVVKDDGCGFSLSEQQTENDDQHFGLLNMKERAEILGGKLIIDTKVGYGTTITMKIPLEQ